MVFIAPSILSADFVNLERDIRTIEEAGADWLHIDVMDGHFVPNLTIGPPVLRRIKEIATQPLDVHLMIEEPGKWVDDYIDAGADRLTFHIEAENHADRVVHNIQSRGVSAGVSLNPATNPESLTYLLPIVDQVLVMSVNPGFGGQSFIGSQLCKIESIAKKLKEIGRSEVEIVVDGGVNTKNAAMIVDAGASVLVSGSAIFKSESWRETIQQLKTI